MSVTGSRTQVSTRYDGIHVKKAADSRNSDMARGSRKHSQCYHTSTGRARKLSTLNTVPDDLDDCDGSHIQDHGGTEHVVDGDGG